MATEKLPEGLVPSGSSLTFTEDTIPDALQKEHKRWRQDVGASSTCLQAACGL